MDHILLWKKITSKISKTRLSKNSLPIPSWDTGLSKLTSMQRFSKLNTKLEIQNFFPQVTSMKNGLK